MAPRLDSLLIPSILCDFRWICVDFMDLGVFWGRRLGGILDGSRGLKETLQSWNLHSDGDSAACSLEAGSLDGDSGSVLGGESYPT